MSRDSRQIALGAVVIALAAWAMEALFSKLAHPGLPFLDLLIFDIPADELAHRLFYLVMITGGVLLVRTLSSRRSPAATAPAEDQDLLDSVFNSIQEGLLIKDNDDTIIRINSVMSQWYAYAMPLVGKKCYEVFQGAGQPCPECPGRQALETEKVSSMVVPKIGPEGAPVGWLEVHAYPLFDRHTGKSTGVIEFAQDITRRRQAEEALRESETRYRLLVNQLPALVIKGYSDWSVDCFDRKIEVLTGYTKEDFDSRRVKWCDVIHPDDLAYATRVFIQALKTDKAYVREHRIKTKSGETRWVQCRGQIFCDEQGKVDYVSGMTFDVTQRKLAEQEAERLASFPQLNPDPLLEVDAAGTITYRNEAATRTLEHLGIPEGERLFLPEDLGEILQAGQEQGERNFYREVCIRDALFEEKIEFVPQFGVARIRAFDITTRKKTEEALQKSQARLAEAQRLAHLGNWEWHTASGETFWSDEVYRILGFAPREIPATFKAFLKTVHPDDRGLVKKALGQALRRGKPYSIEHRIVQPDGSERFVYGHGEVHLDEAGKPARMLGTIQDITERRQAREALRESERRYRLLAENVTDVIWTMDLNLQLAYVSPSIRLLTGHDPIEYKSLELEQMLPPEALVVALNKLKDEMALEEGKPDLSRSMMVEVELFRKDGSTVWTEIKAAFLRDAQGRPTGILGITRDIALRRKLEEQLRQSQKMEVVGQLAGGVAHDFNNLLTAILGYCELLLEALPPDDAAHQDVAEIRKAGERAALLTRQLLAFSRRQVLQPKSLDLNRVVENLGKMLHRVLGEDIELSILPGAELGRVMADPGQIEQVILNLAVNARDAMPQGGRLVLKTANAELDEAYAAIHDQVQPGPHVLLSVSDTGSGMDAATRSHIFEPFFTTKELGKGTGLGLSTVYGIIRQSGGHIWVYSEPGRGTTFKIYLPRFAAEASAPEKAQASGPCLRGQETILLVEDEDLVRQIARRILESHGYSVLEAKDGHEALRLQKEYRGPIHLMLTDLVMPGLNGQELAGRLAARCPKMKVLFMSGYAEMGILDKNLAGQGSVYLQKPFEAHALTRKVRELLDAPPSERPLATLPYPLPTEA